MADDRQQAGEKVQRRLLGDAVVDAGKVQRAANPFGAYMVEHAQGACFADIWDRPVLDLKTRSLLTLALLIPQFAHGHVRHAVAMALNVGVTVEELEEVFYQAVPYAGYPAALSALNVAKEVLTERGLG